MVKGDDIRRQPLSRPVMASAGGNGSEVYIRGKGKELKLGAEPSRIELSKVPPGVGSTKIVLLPTRTEKFKTG